MTLNCIIFIFYDFISNNLIKFLGINFPSFCRKNFNSNDYFLGNSEILIKSLNFKPYQILFGICVYYSLIWSQSYFALANFTIKGFVPNSLGMSVSFFVI